MKGNVESAELFSPVNIEDLPCGDFPGVWGGYQVHVTIGSTQYRLETTEGIRTPRADCIVHIRHGDITVETVQQ